jgi:hypothetical protein
MTAQNNTEANKALIRRWFEEVWRNPQITQITQIENA